MPRAIFLVDGFNLYHSLRAASGALGGAGTRWLDVAGLCRAQLPLISRDCHLGHVVYFSALARHVEIRSPETVGRHQAYLEYLRATGVEVQLSHFKQKRFACPECRTWLTRHEEKETDVAIACRLLEALHAGLFEVAAVISGDSDLAPAFRTATKLHPSCRVLSIQPFHRASKELRQAATAHHSLGVTQYLRHQLPDPFQRGPGRVVHKPAGW